jgi:hypothetical protein
LELARRDRDPLAVGSASAKRVSGNDGEGASLAVRRERADRLPRKLVVAVLAGAHEQSILPCRRQCCWLRHRTIIFAASEPGGVHTITLKH